MPVIIDQQLIDQDSWQLHLEEGPLPSGDVIIPLKRFLAEQDSLAAHAGKVAPLVEPDDNSESLAPYVGQLELIGIHFPVFTDGRGFSHARILRRLGFSGQLRALGDIGRDRLQYMSHCGINAFVMAEERFKPEYLAALNEVSVTYQATANEPRPLFKRWQ
ncbi:DUF934 domain-containing protein [Balneatrix alpica]|uniref:DUF934 domain-containing protein n=1 Tax=Balneatrix alpica TaxID=75684 RepID=UPI0027396B61|nr:DUF934 domain-containing protein [Balneatrix alpica]